MGEREGRGKQRDAQRREKIRTSIDVITHDREIDGTDGRDRYLENQTQKMCTWAKSSRPEADALASGAVRSSRSVNQTLTSSVKSRGGGGSHNVHTAAFTGGRQTGMQYGSFTQDEEPRLKIVCKEEVAIPAQAQDKLLEPPA